MRGFLVAAGYGASHPAPALPVYTDAPGNQCVDVKVLVEMGFTE